MGLRSGALLSGSLLAAAAGVLYAGTSGVADPSSGDTFLLNHHRAGAGQRMGIVRGSVFPGYRIKGLSLLGIQVSIQDLFYGGALTIAVALSFLVRRTDRRERDIAKEAD